jgi:hypothetical protein
MLIREAWNPTLLPAAAMRGRSPLLQLVLFGAIPTLTPQSIEHRHLESVRTRCCRRSVICRHGPSGILLSRGAMAALSVVWRRSGLPIDRGAPFLIRAGHSGILRDPL